jgi:hypothetical protein
MKLKSSCQPFTDITEIAQQPRRNNILRIKTEKPDAFVRMKTNPKIPKRTI